MKKRSSFNIKSHLLSRFISVQVVILFLVTACTGQLNQHEHDEIVFRSGEFKLVGDLQFPEGEGPFPVILFVHGDGPNNRTSGRTYLPIMERMLRAGYATFAWDKPGSGKSTGQLDSSRVVELRAQIVLDAIEVMKARSDILPGQIGLWGISQAGYVMPRVLLASEDVAFMIVVSGPGMPGVDQGAYLVSAQAACAGCPAEEVEQMKSLLSAIERAETYEEWAQYRGILDASPCINHAAMFGYRTGMKSEDEWHKPNLNGAYFWDPMDVIEQTTIPVLVFFGERDTQIDPIQGAQAYRNALEHAGNPNFRIELIPDVDHNLVLSATGCLDEREVRSRKDWTNYAPEYLDILEEWLRELQPDVIKSERRIEDEYRN